MPPLPCTSTRSPGLIAHSTTSARHDVSAAHGSVAASAKLRCSGIAVSADGATRLYCVAQPSVLSPVISSVLSSVGAPSCQFGKNTLITRSPACPCVTPSPTAHPSPAPTDLGIRPPAHG